MATLRFSVADAHAGARLDRALAERAEIGTRSLAERLLRDGAVTVDGATRPKSHRLEPDRSSRSSFRMPTGGLEPEPVTVRIAYEDEHLVVVDKPAGMTVHPGAGRLVGHARRRSSLTLGASGGDDPDRPGIVHRLDRDTSGLLVVARSQEAFAALQEAIRSPRGRTPVPRARAGAAAVADRADRRADRPRSPRSRRGGRSTRTSRAMPSRGSRLVELLAEHALLDVRLETGRTHQIRVHLAAIDLPVVGDATYGVKGDLGLERQFLHAHRLRFAHPVTGAELDLESPLPDGSRDRTRALVRRAPRQLAATSGGLFVPSTRRSAVAGVPSL